MAVSLTHMRANRLLRSAHRAQEAVFYDFLERIYEGRAAREKASQRNAASGLQSRSGILIVDAEQAGVPIGRAAPLIAP
jgi:hypothetical protein